MKQLEKRFEFWRVDIGRYLAARLSLASSSMLSLAARVARQRGNELFVRTRAHTSRIPYDSRTNAQISLAIHQFRRALSLWTDSSFADLLSRVARARWCENERVGRHLRSSFFSVKRHVWSECANHGWRGELGESCSRSQCLCDDCDGAVNVANDRTDWSGHHGSPPVASSKIKFSVRARPVRSPSYVTNSG